MTKEDLDALQALAEKAVAQALMVARATIQGVIAHPDASRSDREKSLGVALNALDEIEDARIRDLEGQKNAGYCAEGDRCACGGDLPRVREGCGNWRTK